MPTWTKPTKLTRYQAFQQFMRTKFPNMTINTQVDTKGKITSCEVVEATVKDFQIVMEEAKIRFKDLF